MSIRKKLSIALIGKSHSEEHKNKIGKSMKGMFSGENNPNYGKHPSDETRKKLSDKAKNRNNSSLKYLRNDT